MPERRHKVIEPSAIELRKVSEIKRSALGHPFYWFELEDMEYGFVAARTMWGKEKDGGTVQWDRIGRDELVSLLSTAEGLATMRSEVRFAVIDPADWADVLDPNEWIVPPAIVWFKDEVLQRAIRESRRPANSGSTEAKHIMSINRDRQGPYAGQ
jgi:hypothetical protein